MKLIESNNELVLRDTPGCLWIFGVFFIVISGTFLYGATGGFTNYDEVPPWAIAATRLMAMCGIGVGLWIIFNAPVTTTTITRILRRVEIRKKGLFRRQQTVYEFSRIKEFKVATRQDSEGDDYHEIVLNLKDDSEIDLTTVVGNRNQADYERIAQKLNDFIN